MPPRRQYRPVCKRCVKDDSLFNAYSLIRYMVDYLFVVVTAIVAYHGLTFRDDNGESEFIHLLFGAIALLFCLRVLFVDILKLI